MYISLVLHGKIFKYGQIRIIVVKSLICKKFKLTLLYGIQGEKNMLKTLLLNSSLPSSFVFTFTS